MAGSIARPQKRRSCGSRAFADLYSHTDLGLVISCTNATASGCCGLSYGILIRSHTWWGRSRDHMSTDSSLSPPLVTNRFTRDTRVGYQHECARERLLRVVLQACEPLPRLVGKISRAHVNQPLVVDSFP